MKNIDAYFDGSCKDNPGQIGSYGFHITHPYYIEGKGILRGYITNNISEYYALKSLLEALIDNNIYKANIYGDSNLIVNTVNKVWGMKKDCWNPHKNFPILNKLAKECRSLFEIGDYTLKHIYRDKNHIADSIAESAYTDYNCKVINVDRGIYND
jgi:ribonuclease HI